jgi:hypothetical protein|tara:strand:- start:52 stop:309 length:258 start_codon:yes stop_codon:yes gene_type:complete
MSEVIKKIKNLKNEESLNFVYNDKTYRLKAYNSYDNKIDYAVWGGNGINGMNVSKFSKKYISLYSYDMMCTRTIYKMSIDKISIA